MTEEIKQDHVSVGHYAVAFLDLLSQKDRLAKLNELPQNDKQMHEFIINLKKSVGVVDMFRKAMIASIAVTELPLLNGAMTSDPRFSCLWSDVYKIKIRHKFFSDCFVLWVPLRSDQGGIPVAAVFHLMQSVSYVFSVALGLGHTCRGGIDIGVAGEFFAGEIYGPALSNAYRLESEKANYPRIVIGKSLQKYLAIERPSSHQAQEIPSIVRRKINQSCSDLIATDQDGQYILDYFGLGAAQMMGAHSLGLYDKALLFCLSQISEFSDAANTKLLSKYTLLHQYLRSREYLWSKQERTDI